MSSSFAALGAFTFLVGGTACHSIGSSASASVADREIANLHAFARLYGVLRWFHPSDTAAAADWDQVAVDGVRRVSAAGNADALREALTEVIQGIAPTARIASSLDKQLAVPDRAPAGTELVAWEHLGYGDSTLVSEYASKRRHRDRVVAIPGYPFAAISQKIPAAGLEGHRIRLRGRVRTAHHGLGRLFLRVDASDRRAFFDNMRDHPSASAAWTSVEIVGTVDPAATQIVFGTVMAGVGTVWYDDLTLEVAAAGDVWRPIEIADPGFESPDLFVHWKKGTGGETGSLDGWNATLDREAPGNGRASLRVEAETRRVSDELFPEGPNAGETYDLELGSGLRARVPLVLESRGGHTLGDLDSPPRPPVAADQRATDLADVIVVWNAFQHFWPYWDVVAVDWAAKLDQALSAARKDRSVDDHAATLRRLIAAAPDGHAGVTCIGESSRALPAFAVDFADGQLTVTATATPQLSVGDVILSVERRPVAEYLHIRTELISGTPQWRQLRALDDFGSGPQGAPLLLGIRRGTVETSVSVPRVSGARQVELARRPSVELQPDGIYYVDLARVEMTDLEPIMARLAHAPGVVFDARSTLHFIHEVLGHLVTKPIDISQGLSIPHIIRPDHLPSSFSGQYTTPAPVAPTAPRFEGRIAFLVGAGTISYGETVMAQVEQYHLGAIIGGATGGTNGNMAEITTPGGCRVTFTATLAKKPDGRAHHLIGIRPSIPVARTLAGVRAGRDEVLERGLEYVRTGS